MPATELLEACEVAKFKLHMSAPLVLDPCLCADPTLYQGRMPVVELLLKKKANIKVPCDAKGLFIVKGL